VKLGLLVGLVCVLGWIMCVLAHTAVPSNHRPPRLRCPPSRAPQSARRTPPRAARCCGWAGGAAWPLQPDGPHGCTARGDGGRAAARGEQHALIPAVKKGCQPACEHASCPVNSSKNPVNRSALHLGTIQGLHMAATHPALRVQPGEKGAIVGGGSGGGAGRQPARAICLSVAVRRHRFGRAASSPPPLPGGRRRRCCWCQPSGKLSM
jgi:hypothetical protein